MPTLINRSINLDQSKRFVDTIFLTQGEGGATTLNFSLMQSGAVIDLTGCTVNFLAKKPSGATLTNACTLTNAAQGKVAYVVTTQTAIEAGALTDARLEVLKSGVAWKSFKFPVTVEAVPDYTTAIQSTNEFTTLQSLTPQITASTTAIGTLASLLTTAKNSLVAAINELFDRSTKQCTAYAENKTVASATTTALALTVTAPYAGIAIITMGETVNEAAFSGVIEGKIMVGGVQKARTAYKYASADYPAPQTTWMGSVASGAVITFSALHTKGSNAAMIFDVNVAFMRT